MPAQPVPPPEWDLPDPAQAIAGQDVVAVGAGLDPGTLLSAYSRGLFPMELDLAEEIGGGHTLGWWSPDPRGVLELDDLRVSRSLAKSVRRFEITVDLDFEAVMRACGDPARPHGWITEQFVAAYVRLHELGYAHSIEVRRAGTLVGGLYGVEIGGLFAGESMFHFERDASKVALVALVDTLRSCPGDRLIDVQWCTDHLASLGAREWPRQTYLARLPSLLASQPCLG